MKSLMCEKKVTPNIDYIQFLKYNDNQMTLNDIKRNSKI